MLMMEVETDPLSLRDPLDCSGDIQSNSEDFQEWITKTEPEVILKRLEEKEMKNEENEKKMGKSLRVRKPKKESDFIMDYDDLESSWKFPSKKEIFRQRSVKKKRKTNSGKKSVSDEENLVPAVEETKKLLRAKIKRERYLEKYKIMREKRTYVCDLCKKTFITASHLKEHILSHFQCFPCKECGKVFNHPRSLQRHKSARHDSNFSIKTDKEEEKKNESNKVLKTKGSIERNNRCKKYYEQLKSERKYQCEICAKTFITSGHLNTHMYCHSGKKWKCEGCNKNFSCERSLTRHKDSFPGEHWFPCQLCDMTFFRVTNIVKHVEIKHPEIAIDAKRAKELNLPLQMDEKRSETENGANSNAEKLFNCSICLKIFYSPESLQVHKEAMHLPKKFDEEKKPIELVVKDEPKYKCDICFKEFISLEGFEYHRNHQHVEKELKKKKKRKGVLDNENKDEKEKEENENIVPANFICKICSTSFSVKMALQVHLKSHNVTKNKEVKSGSHQCCICPRSFASSDGLKYHLATHTGERRYSCSQCGKKFIKKAHLSEHIATHSEIKYFRCLRCPRTFSTHSAYKKHVKHFPGPHSFPCKKCGKLFTKESMLEKHMCVDLVKITMAPEVRALLNQGMIEEYLCLADEQAAEELARNNAAAESIESSSEKPKNVNEIKFENETEKGPHSCYKCFKVFPSLNALQTHQYEHIGKQNYQCRFCPENFKRADTFGAHIRNHLGSSPYMCLKCNRKFISPLTLSMHAKNYPGDHSFSCKKCQRWFTSEKRLEKHECILQNSDEFVCACKSVFKNWNELLQHAGLKPYKCCSCQLTYPTLMALVRHIKKHTGVKPFSCEVCGKSFRAKNNYLHHKNVHNDTKEIECKHCEFKSKSQKRIDFHLFRKHDIGSHSTSTLCSICGIIFPFITHMKKHVEEVHGNEMGVEESKDDKKALPTVLCTLCGKLLNNKYTLASHMKKVHDPDGPKNRPKKELKCKVCNENFKSLRLFQRHAEIHETPFLRSCEVCLSEFYYAEDLRKHMRKHDTCKPFICQKCGKNFKVSAGLKYHSSICGTLNSQHVQSLQLNNQSYTVVYKT